MPRVRMVVRIIRRVGRRSRVVETGLQDHQILAERDECPVKAPHRRHSPSLWRRAEHAARWTSRCRLLRQECVRVVSKPSALAVRADLLATAGRSSEAVEVFRVAAQRTANDAERRHLLNRAMALEPGASD